MPSAPYSSQDSVAQFGTTVRGVVSCRVCGRTLLMGERSTGFFTASGEGPFDVCELCVPRARGFGLLPRPVDPDSLRRHGRRSFWGRSRRVAGPAVRPAGAATVTAPASAATPAAAPPAVAPRNRRGGWRARLLGAAPVTAAAAARAAGTAPVGTAGIPLAIATFNESPHARTLAGLYKTLGAPRASVAPRSATDREVIITVAWEIVWYQFRILPEGDVEATRGTYIEDLAARWRQWNCAVTSAGQVLTPAADALAGDGGQLA